MAHSNVNVLRSMDEAMTRGDLEHFFSQYTDDVVVHIAGDSKLTGECVGVGELQSLFGHFMEASGEYSFENYSYFADESRGVILQRGTMKRGGDTFSTDEVFVYRFRDGKVAEFWYLPFDQEGVDAWFGK